jgi:hypothetical protein
MSWLIGIDEAGYGPNLGPLVVSSVAVRVSDPSTSLGDVLRPVVRRACEDEDDRLLLDDSKQVYVGPNGLAKLERGVLPVVASDRPERLTIGEYLNRLGAGASRDDLKCEPWYEPDELLPVAIEPDEWGAFAERLTQACGCAGVAWGPARSVVVPTPRFNGLLERWQVKSAVEAEAIITLMREARGLPGSAPLHFAIDRLGGRIYYAGLIQTAFPDGWVMAHDEKADCCRYSILGLEREIHLCFEPRADGSHLPVAVASMACKYLREVCMRQFNRFWQGRVPDLEPTAGYPGDADRFFRAIRPAMREMGIARDQVWRRK